jgi:hypothetical protein
VGRIARIENGDLTGRRPPTLARLKLWLQAGVRVERRPDWLFVKLDTHGTQDANAAMLLGEPMRRFHISLLELATRDEKFRYYYVTTWEMAALVHGAESRATDPAAILSGR